MEIRRAARGDIGALARLLLQVHKVHSDARPDLFRPGARKYTDEELAAILEDDARPVFAAVLDGKVAGYAFCVLQRPEHANMVDALTLYIDDLCVDEACRGRGVGRALYEHVLAFARKAGCHNLTLNVWEGNPGARRFYERMGLGVQKTGMETLL